LFNGYADPGSYYDICLLIFEAANHRTPTDINATWQYYLSATHQKIVDDPNATEHPWEAVVNVIRQMGPRLSYSELTFSPSMLIPMIEAYAFNNPGGASPTWVPDLFIHVKFSHESIVATLQNMYYNETQPFVGRNKRVLAEHIVYVCQQWYNDCIRNNKAIFGSDDNAREIDELLQTLTEAQAFAPQERDQAMALRRSIANYL
jgi:nuclear pore complex protein Nup155